MRPLRATLDATSSHHRAKNAPRARAEPEESHHAHHRPSPLGATQSRRAAPRLRRAPPPSLVARRARPTSWGSQALLAAAEGGLGGAVLVPVRARLARAKAEFVARSHEVDVDAEFEEDEDEDEIA